MTAHKDHLDDLLFRKPVPFLLCMIVFQFGNLVGLVRALLWHYPAMFILAELKRPGWRTHARFVWRFFKSSDCVAGVALVNCRHDETISNKAGRLCEQGGVHAPRWAIEVERITGRWHKRHVFDSIELRRREPFDNHDPTLLHGYPLAEWMAVMRPLAPNLAEAEFAALMGRLALEVPQ